MIGSKYSRFGLACVSLILITTAWGAEDSAEQLRAKLDRLEIRKDFCVMLGLPRRDLRTTLSEFVQARDLTVFF